MVGRHAPTGPPDPATHPVRQAAAALADAALRSVQTPDGRVRVEDYLATLAAVAGEAALVASEVIDPETTTLPPGSAVFGEAINRVLSGDAAEDAPTDSVFGLFTSELVPDVVPHQALPSLESIYRFVAEHVGDAPWGDVTTSVPQENVPSVLPIRAAFEMRAGVDAAQHTAALPTDRRHVPCVLALCSAIRQTYGAIDITVAASLALEVTFSMAKMVPMSHRAFEAAPGPPTE